MNTLWSICQMWLQVMEGSLIYLSFLGISIFYYMFETFYFIKLLKIVFSSSGKSIEEKSKPKVNIYGHVSLVKVQ